MRHGFNALGEISATIYGAPRRLLIDTGAQRSALSHHIFGRLPKFCQKSLRPNRPQLLGANRNRLQVLGTIELDLDLQGLKIRHPFLVIKDLVNDFIIGSDLLAATSAQINYEDRTVAFFDNFLHVPLQTRRPVPDTRNVLRLEAGITVPPRCAVLAPIRVPPSFVNVLSIVQALQATPRQQFCVGSCLVRPKRGKSVVNILNPFDHELYIPKGRPIASIHEAAHVSDVPSVPPASATMTSTASSPDVATRNAALEHLGLTYASPALTSDQTEMVADLIYKNRDVFALSLADLPGTNLIQHDIVTCGEPKRQRAFRHSLPARDEIEKQVKEMLAHGIVRESDSLWASPVILVSKRDDLQPRLCVDLRAMNLQTKPLHFPLPTLSSVLDVLAERAPKFYGALDLKSGFWQVPLTPRGQECCSFVTQTGNYSFLRLPFGARNASASFQKLMQMVFREELNQFILVYIDDLLIFSGSFDEHLRNLQIVFDKLRAAQLKLHPRKCKFAVKKVPFLGHLLTENGIEVDPSKVSKVKEFPRPRTVHQLRQFLGLCNFYRQNVC